MRNLSPTERGYLTDPEGHWAFAFLEVTNFDGTWINVGSVAIGARTADFLNTFSVSDNIDANTLSMSATLLREIGAYSLVPFRSDSPLNVDDASAYSPLLDLHRSWRLWGVILPIDTFPSDPSDYREWWTGIVDRIDVQGDPATITVQGRGMEADIIDAKIAFVDNTADPPAVISKETPKTYASGDLPDVLQAILDEEMGVGAVPLTVDPSAPAFFVNGWSQESDIGLMDLVSETAALPGALLRYKYDSADVLTFTLFAPNRTPSTPDWATDGGEYEKLDVGIGLDAVRGYAAVRYFDETFGAPLVVTSPNASPAAATSASIARFRRRTITIDLAASTQVNDQTGAGNLADAVRADLEFPIIEHTLTGRGFWFAELGDYVQILANGVHYDQDQFGGITSIQHTFANGELKSVLGMRAKPAGRYRGWLDFGPGAPRTPFTPGITKYTADYWETYDVDDITLTGAGVMDLGEVNAYTRSVAIEVGTDPTFALVEFIEYTDVAASGTFTDQWAGASRASIYYFRATPWSGPLSAGLPTGIAGPPAIARTWNTPQVPTKPQYDSDIGAINSDIAAETAARIAGDAAQQAYTDAKLAGLSWKQAVRAATTVAGTLASSFENGDTVDGVVLATGDRILIKNQASASENGIYVVAASGAPTRATDADVGSELVNASCYVSEGTTNADTQWTCSTNAPITLGSTSLVFAQQSSGGGAVSSVFGRTGAVVAVAGDYAVADITGAAPLASPAFTGNPTVPTASPGDNDTTAASTAFVAAALVAGGYGGSTPLYTVWDPYIPDSSPHAQNDEFTSNTIANWTGIYTGDASVVSDIATTVRAGLYTVAPNVQYRMRARMKAIIAGDWTVHTCVVASSIPVTNGAGNCFAGILLADGTTAGAGLQTGVVVSRPNPLAGGRLTWAKYGNDATSALFDTSRVIPDSGDTFIRLRRVSGVYFMAFSADGENYSEEQTITLLSSFTPTHWGLFLQNYTGLTAITTFRFFRVYATGTQMKTGNTRVVYA